MLDKRLLDSDDMTQVTCSPALAELPRLPGASPLREWPENRHETHETAPVVLNDGIVIDSAPVPPAAGTFTIAPLRTGTIVAASITVTDRNVASTVGLLHRTGVRLLGAVATQIEARACSSDRGTARVRRRFHVGPTRIRPIPRRPAAKVVDAP